MKKLILLGMLLIGCEQKAMQQPHPRVCWKLDMCDVRIQGGDSPFAWPVFTAYCIYGYDAQGNKTGDVKRFFARDALSAWSILHPEEKNCE